MAVETVDVLSELASPATNDELGIWDVSAGQFKKIQVANLIGATITGGGTIALGGYTLTVPATGTVALLGTANTFTADQTISKVSPTVSVTATTGQAFLYIPNADNGNGAGHLIQIGRNSNASTPAAGYMIMVDKGGAAYSLWVDDGGNLRIQENGNPITANDGAGTVVGTQTSSLDSKDVIGAPVGIDDVLAAVRAGADAVRRFTYKSGAYGGEEFSGVVTDYAPGMVWTATRRTRQASRSMSSR